MKGRKLDTETSLFWVKVKSTMLHHAPHESIGGYLSPSSRPWTNKWRENHCHYLVASVTPDPWLPSQPQGITAHWLVPNYTAWWQIHMCLLGGVLKIRSISLRPRVNRCIQFDPISPSHSELLFQWKKVLGEMQTLCAGHSNVEPKKFQRPHTPFPQQPQ